MPKFNKDHVITLLSMMALFQTGVIIDLAISAKRNKLEADKYAAIVTYYNDIVHREEIELSDYDLIALSTMFNDGREYPS